MAEGWLCVSTLKQTLNWSSKWTTPALSSKTLTHQSAVLLLPFARMLCVAAKMVSLSRLVNWLRRKLLIGGGGTERTVVRDSAGERFVAAMLAPGLRHGFQLDVGRIAVEVAEVGLDGFHFDERQKELPFSAELHKGSIVHVPQGNGDELEFVFASKL